MYELILLSLSRHCIYIYITRFLKVTNKNDVIMTQFCLHELCRSHSKTNVSLKFLGNHLYAPNSPDLNAVDYTVWGDSAAERVLHCDFQPGHLKDRVHTCRENLDRDHRLIYWSLADNLKAVVRLNGGHFEQLFDYLLHLLLCCYVACSKNMRAFAIVYRALVRYRDKK